MPLIHKLEYWQNYDLPLIFFRGGGTITCHTMKRNIDHYALTDMFKHVNIDFKDVGYGSSYKISIEQEFLLKSMLNDGEYSDKVVGLLEG